MRKFTFWLSALFLVFGLSVATAQTKVISGKVTDSSGALPGVSVVVKGTTKGTQTDFDGKYSLSANVGDVLVFSFVGMEPTSKTVGAANVIDVKMTEGAMALEEVVVVGYGTQTRREVTGAISTVSGEKLNATRVQSFDQALSGAASGVNVSSPNGVLGNQAVIRVRGVSSISLSSYPLIVIDGVPTWNGDNINQSQAANNPLSSVNSSDIESVEILKDAAASAIYGSRAAAGVILITTKKGKQGKTKVNFQSSVSVTSPYKLIEVLNAENFTMIKNEGLTNFGTPPNGTTIGFYTMTDANGDLVDTNWYDYAYRDGIANDQSINISGASETTKYYLSVGRLDQEGMFINNNFKRLNGRFSLDHKINNWLSLGGVFNYTNSITDGLSTGSANGGSFNSFGAARLAFAQAPNVGPYNNDGTYSLNGNVIGKGNNKSNLQWGNAKYVLDHNTFTAQNDHVMSNFYANFKLAKGLNFKTLYGIDNLLVENKDWLSAVHGDGNALGGAATNTMNRYTRSSIQNVLNYSTTLFQKHNLSALVGSEGQYSETNTWGASRRGVSDPFFDEYQGGFSTIIVSGNLLVENYLESYFGRVNYDFDNKYYLSVNARRDGYSAFAEGNKWGDFYGASLGWVLSEEGFFKNSGIAKSINLMKFRGSYGSVGNNQGISSYAASSFYDAGLNGTNGTLFYSQAGNKNLTWETSKKMDFGMNFGLFDNRITGEFGYYKSDVDGLILNVRQAASTGIPNGNAILANVGSMYNKGIEATLNAQILTQGDFKWNTSINFTTQTNKVTSLDATGADILIASSNLESANIVRVGESVGSFYVVRTGGVNPVNGRRIFYHRDGTAVQYDHSAAVANRWTKVSDGSVTRAASQSSDGVVMGPSIPKYFGGFTNSFKYKGFDFDINLYYSGGNYVYNGTKAGLRDMRVWNNANEVLTRWQKAGDITEIPKIVFGDNVSNGSSMPSSQNVEKGDFVKIRNIALGYNLSDELVSKLGLSSFKFNLSVQNAYTFTKYSGFDPEISSNGNSGTSAGVDRNSAPLARTVSFGLNLGL
ncbi:MAG: SusC/RagA family TonB-linked outer membrane protein [Flavobacteriaceae bacterium]|nr:SusC/RagA family TonB-linked outer membrane protein [Flavobacteriaceae bacterium]